MNHNRSWETAVPVIMDGLTLVALFVWLPPLARQFETPSGINALWLTAVFILFWFAVLIIRKLEPATEPSPLPKGLQLGDARLRGLLGLVFALTITTAISYQLGYFDSMFNPAVQMLNEGEAAVFFVFGPSAWLGMALIYIIFLAFNVRQTIAADAPNRPLLSGMALLDVNLLLLLFIAQGRALLVVTERAEWGLFPLALIALTLLFAPPRLIYQAKQSNLIGLISFDLLLWAGSWWVIAGGW